MEFTARSSWALISTSGTGDKFVYFFSMILRISWFDPLFVDGEVRGGSKMDTQRGILWINVALLVLCAFVGSVSATTWYVDDSSGADFTTIQDAVTAANAGDTIIVRDGTYTENIDVNKLLTIRSENGSVNCIVYAANPDDHVFAVTADYVTISGFTVKLATGVEKRGIYLSSVNHCTISENTASNNCTAFT